MQRRLWIYTTTTLYQQAGNTALTTVDGKYIYRRSTIKDG